MSLLVKETCTLFKVLFKYLSSDALKKIMAEVFRTYSQKLDEELRKLDLFSSAGKNRFDLDLTRLLIDVQYYIEKLGSLDGIDGPGNHLEVVVNNIKIKDKRAIVNSTNIRSSASLDFGSSGSLNTVVSPSMPSPEKNLSVPASANARKYSMFTNFTMGGSKGSRSSSDN